VVAIINDDSIESPYLLATVVSITSCGEKRFASKVRIASQIQSEKPSRVWEKCSVNVIKIKQELCGETQLRICGEVLSVTSDSTRDRGISLVTH